MEAKKKKKKHKKDERKQGKRERVRTEGGFVPGGVLNLFELLLVLRSFEEVEKSHGVCWCGWGVGVKLRTAQHHEGFHQGCPENTPQPHIQSGPRKE